MEPEKKRLGRPPSPAGPIPWKKQTLLLTEVEDQGIRQIAAAETSSVAQTMRRLIREEMKRCGL